MNDDVMKKIVKLRTKMLIWSFILVLSSVTVSGLIMIFNVSSAFEEEIGERAIAIARTISQTDGIENHLGEEGGYEYIQPIAERVRLSTNVDYVVILDMNGIRYSHPSESKIGQYFQGGDEVEAYSEQEYISKAEGDLGYAIRAFVPIMDSEGVDQIGVAVVGILSPTFQSLVSEYQVDLLFSLVWGLLIGLIGSWFLANNVKKQTYQLEPYEISRIVEERSTIMETLDVGIIATYGTGNISFMNSLAKRYIGISDYTNMNVQDVLDQPLLLSYDNLKNKIVNKPFNLNKEMYLISIYPIYVKDEFTGDLITLKNRSEINQLGEELTGVKSLVSALRAQNHEHMNKMHSIAGLIQLGKTEEALELMIDETSYEETMVQFLRDNITHYAISGLLLGKRSRGKELGVQVTIDQKSVLMEVVEGFMPGDVVSILGNLLDNAIEACMDEKEKEVLCLVQGNEDFLYIHVEDSGKGMSEEEVNNMFIKGFSSKADDGRGFGLFLVKEIVEANDGTIEVMSKQGMGTTVEIEIKHVKEVER